MSAVAWNEIEREAVAICAARTTLRGYVVLPPSAAAVVVIALPFETTALAETLAENMHVASIRIALDDEAVDVLAPRIAALADWARLHPSLDRAPLGLVAGGHAGAAALVVASARTDVSAVVACDSRLDLAGAALERVRAPALLLVDETDDALVAVNRSARMRLKESELSLVARDAMSSRAFDFVAKTLA